MPDQIHVNPAATSAPVIRVDGLCYQRVGPSDQPVDTELVDAEFDLCEQCLSSGSSSGVSSAAPGGSSSGTLSSAGSQMSGGSGASGAPSGGSATSRTPAGGSSSSPSSSSSSLCEMSGLFDGTSQYALGTLNAPLAMPYTISGWCYQTDDSQPQTSVLILYNPPDDTPDAWWYYACLFPLGSMYSDFVRAQYGDGPITGALIALSSEPFTLSTWYHYAAVFDNNLRKIYINGILRGIDTTVNLTNLPLSKLVIGANEPNAGSSFPSNSFFPGNISRVVLDNAALDDATIAARYAASDPTAVSGGTIVGFWLPHCASDWNDHSGNGNDLTPVGSPTFSANEPSF